MKLRILLSALAFLAGPIAVLGLLWCAGPIQRGELLATAFLWGLILGGAASAATWHKLDPNL